MKKVLVIVFALLLALPAASFAGNATSLWDLEIGGMVKFDEGWTTGDGGGKPAQLRHALYRPSIPQSVATKYGNQIWGTGETDLNFFIKGPDAFGAKTHAFILGDFIGRLDIFGRASNNTALNTGNSATNYGTFDLIFANMGLDWANTSLLLGRAPRSSGHTRRVRQPGVVEGQLLRRERSRAPSHPGDTPDAEVQQGVEHPVRRYVPEH